jgi:hypothetical protein
MHPGHEHREASSTIEDLQRQHRDHERRLEELMQHPSLSPDEEMEAKRLKKLKLQLKDQIEVLRRTTS